MTIQPDNKIFAPGHFYRRPAIWCRKFTRKTADSNGAEVLSAIGRSANDNACVAIQADQKIVVAGNAIIWHLERWFCRVKISFGWYYDSTFGNSGKVILSVGDYCYDACRKVLIQQDERHPERKFCPVSNDTLGSSMVRLNPDGSLDTSFEMQAKV